MVEWIESLPFWAYLFLAAGGGGLAGFLLACKKGWIKNNKHVKKMALETAGGSIVGFVLGWGVPSPNDKFTVFVAFAGGLGWGQVIQAIRTKTTDIVEAAFFGIKRYQKEGDSDA